MKNQIRFILVIALVLSLNMSINVAAASIDSGEKSQTEYGYLVSTNRYDNGDGTYSVESIYTEHTPSFYASEMYGTDTFTKVKENRLNTGALIVTYQVTATFDWDTRTNKVKVYDEKGELTYNQGGDITNEVTATSGNNTSKATAKYSFTRTTNLGFSKDYSVSISCDYKGKDS